MLAYVQSFPPPFEISIQNFPLPVAFELLSEFIDPLFCALASEMPAISAAMAVKVVMAFIIRLLGFECLLAASSDNLEWETSFRELPEPGTSRK
jgi:hypothetical protein